MGLLRDFLPRNTYAVVASYRGSDLVVVVAAAMIDDDDGLLLQFTHDHALAVGDAVTVQLDSRMDVARITPELPIYRTSLKGDVVGVDRGTAQVRPQQFEIYYSDKRVGRYQAPGFQFFPDPRPSRALGSSALEGVSGLSDLEAKESLGVLVTRGPQRPHSTVMAFLSSDRGDIFFVTDPASFKAQNLQRDNRAVFAVDFRASYDLEKPLDWSYRIQPVTAALVPPTRPLYGQIRKLFLEKNPWNMNFFTAPNSILVHLDPQAV